MRAHQHTTARPPNGGPPDTFVDATASAQPTGEVTLGTTGSLVGAAEVVYFDEDGTRHVVKRLHTGSWTLQLQMACTDPIDATYMLTTTSGLRTTFVPWLYGIYTAQFVAHQGLLYGSAEVAITVVQRRVVVGPDVQVTFDSNPANDRSESSLAANPLDPQNMVGSSKKFWDPRRYGFTLAAYATFDGGQSWSEASLPLPEGWEGTSDPAVAWGSEGDAYIVALPFQPQSDPKKPTLVGDIIGIGVYRSTDGGLTWGQPTLIHASVGDDKQAAVGDGNRTSPHFGNVYATWDDSNLDRDKKPVDSTLRFARSTDHGATWHGVGAGPVGTQLSDNAAAQFSTLAVAPDGTLHLAWIDQKTNSIKAVKSSDGGDSFSTPIEVAIAITQLRSAPLPKPDEFPELPGGTFRVDTFPTICAGLDGVVVVAWADYRDGVSRIYYQRSLDAGATWDSGGPPSGRPLLVGAAIPRSYIHDFHPQLAVNANGDIVCAFYEFGPIVGGNLINVIAAVSEDNGACFWRRVTVTDRPWDPAVDAPQAEGEFHTTFIGDYFGLAASDLGFFPFWTDTRTGIQEIFTSKISITGQRRVCAINTLVDHVRTKEAAELATRLRRLRDRELRQTDVGREVVCMLETHAPELEQMLADHGELRDSAWAVLQRIAMIATPVASRFDDATVKSALDALRQLEALASPQLGSAIGRARQIAAHLSGRTLDEGLATAPRT